MEKEQLTTGEKIMLLETLKDALSGKQEQNVDEIRIATNCASEIVVTSKISINERLYQRLKTTEKQELKRVQQHIPLICAITSHTCSNGNTRISALVIRVPEGHNTIQEIMTLASTVKTVHEMILESLSQDTYLDNIQKDLKQFNE